MDKDKKVLIVFKPDETEGINAFIINAGDEYYLTTLERWRADGSIQGGDLIYEAKLLWVAREQREIVLTAMPHRSK
ncbi:hypothetical protein LCGC14_0964800 [marine sediment metagenome]|uniref:Uncharacterized protein n=1 Tax=marine sediment metagenome TaxID=412755 RepID=A0A0F9NDI7_9ZZZZ